ncbi:MAG: hypothetical protein JWM68_4144 [Verrucomicrobiales bacterium]|nr:hypothetical protein [Verrucomicrobiales bacterium]
MTLFLSFFNYWAFMAGGPLLVKAVVGLFDLLLIYGWYQGVLAVGRALKFGNSRIEFIQFPYRLTTPINIRWKAPSGIVHANKGSFTLRCVEEWFEQRGSGKNRGQFLVQEEVWRGTWFLNEPATFTRNEESELHFEPPAKLPSTSLLTHRAVYWELEAKLDLPGLDFEECYLVPVY